MLKACIVADKIYSFTTEEKTNENYIFSMKDMDYSDLEIFQDLYNSFKSEIISEFMEFLCLCHSTTVTVKTHFQKEIIKKQGGDGGVVINEVKFTDKKFNSSVAEEKAMLKALKNFGFSIDKVNQKEITLNINDNIKTYYVLGQNKFSESRNRMSVILKRHKNDKGNNYITFTSILNQLRINLAL